MKLKFILFLFQSLILVGLFFPMDAKAQTSGQGRLNPQIAILPGYIYRPDEGGYDLTNKKYIAVTTNTVNLSANMLRIDLRTDADFTTEALSHVRLIGHDRPFHLTQDSRSRYLYIEMPNGQLRDHYTLVLDAGLNDAVGNTLGQERRIEIRIQTPTRARFDLLGADETFQDIGFDDHYDPIISGRHLTCRPKDFRIIFSRPVNRSSVEESINEGLSDHSESWSFRWKDDRTLSFHIDKQVPKEPDGHRIPNFQISLKTAIDAVGNPIRGMMAFDVDIDFEDSCRLSRIDLASNKISVIREFKDWRYMTLSFPTVGRFIILDDGRQEHAFDISQNTFDPKPLTGYIYDRNMCWVDDTRFLSVQESRLTLRNLVDGKESVIYGRLAKDTGSDRISLSPDGRLIALIQPRLSVISMAGQLLYQTPLRLFQHDILPAEVNICWLDNRSFIYDALADQQHQEAESLNCNIYQLDLMTSKTTTLVPGGRQPVTSPRGQLIFQRTADELFNMTYHHRTGDHERELLACHGHHCSNFRFVDEDRIVFERDNEIVLLDLASGKDTVLTTGTIIGLSKDCRILYTNNFKGELHYMD